MLVVLTCIGNIIRIHLLPSSWTRVTVRLVVLSYPIENCFLGLIRSINNYRSKLTYQQEVTRMLWLLNGKQSNFSLWIINLLAGYCFGNRVNVI